MTESTRWTRAQTAPVPVTLKDLLPPFVSKESGMKEEMSQLFSPDPSVLFADIESDSFFLTYILFLKLNTAALGILKLQL